jgi:hypothetical protein
MELNEILETSNVLEEMTEDETMKLKAETIDSIQADFKEHEARIEVYKDIQKTSRAQTDEPTKTFPWDGASNVKYPLILSESNAMSSMLVTALLQDSIVKGIVVGKDEVEVKDKQAPTGVSMKPLGKQDRADRVAFYTNYMLKYGMPYWEETTDALFQRLALYGSQFKKTYYDVIEDKVKSELVSFEDIMIAEAECLEESPRITHKFSLSKSQIIGNQRAGLYVECDLAETKNDQYEICETHFYYDLDDDGIKEPYILTHIKDGELLSLQKRFDKYMITYNDKEEVVSIETELNFTKYGFIKDSESLIYDIGFGQFLMPMNKTINTIVNQLIDAGTLANTSGGIISGGAGLKSGSSLKVQMGEYKILNQVSDIRNNLVEISGKEPSQTLFALLGTLTQASKEITSIKNLSPENINPNTPATTTLLMLEQGLNEFKAIYKRIHRSLKEEVKKILYFQSKYGSIESYLDIMDFGEASKEDFEKKDEYMIVPINSSRSLTSGQEMTRASAIYQAKDSDPRIDPEEATKLYIKALGIDDPDTIMREPPVQQPNPMEEMSMKLDLQLKDVQNKLIGAQATSIEDKTKLDRMQQAIDTLSAKLNARNELVKTDAEAILKLSKAKQTEESLNEEKQDVKDIAGTLSIPKGPNPFEGEKDGSNNSTTA